MRGKERDEQFVEFFTARGQALRRTAYGLCGDWQRAEDLVQGTFVRLYRYWSRIRLDDAEPYARRILVNLFFTDRRRGSSQEIPAEYVPEVADRAAEPVNTDQRLDLERALARLPARQRAVVVLRFLDDMSVQQVAQILDLAEGTVKSHTARALETLRHTIDLVETKD